MTENIDIIVSRYNEDLNWINEYPFNLFQYIVYNKGNNDNFNKNNIKQIINLPNVGRESHSYLYHIVNNYENNLANINVFLPGSLDLIHKKNKSIKLLNLIINSKYNNAFFIGEHKKSIYNFFKDFKLEYWNTNHYKNKELNNNFSLELAKLRPYGLWYKYFFGNKLSHWYTYYGIFSIHKNDILQSNIEIYKKLLLVLSYSANPECGHYMERSWGVLFYPMIFTKKILE